MKTEKISLKDFIKKFKKQHPEMKSQRATRQAKIEYKKYLKNLKLKKKDEKDLKELLKFDEKVQLEEKKIKN